MYLSPQPVYQINYRSAYNRLAMSKKNTRSDFSPYQAFQPEIATQPISFSSNHKLKWFLAVFMMLFPGAEPEKMLVQKHEVGTTPASNQMTQEDSLMVADAIAVMPELDGMSAEEILELIKDAEHQHNASCEHHKHDEDEAHGEHDHESHHHQ